MRYVPTIIIAWNNRKKDELHFVELPQEEISKRQNNVVKNSTRNVQSNLVKAFVRAIETW